MRMNDSGSFFDMSEVESGFQISEGLSRIESHGNDNFRWQINTGIGDFAKKFAVEMERLCDEVILSIVKDASNLAPEKTGALKAGLYAMTARLDTSADASSSARKLNPEGDINEILEPPSNRFIGKMGSIMAYWEDVEFGRGYGGKAQPFIEPAFRLNAGKITQGLQHYVDQAAAQSGFKTNVAPNADWAAKKAATSDFGFLGD